MSKNKQGHRASKETREADAFIQGSGKVVRWIYEQRTVLLVAVLTFLIGGGGYAFYSWNKNKKEMTAQMAFFSAEKKFLELKEKRQKAKDEFAKQNEDKKTNAVKGEFYPSGDLNADYGQSVEELKQVVTHHAGTKAAALASLTIGQIYIDYDMFEQADVELAKIANSMSDSGFTSGLVAFQRGTIAEAQGKCPAAIEYWQSVIGNKATKFLAPNAMLKQAVCYHGSENLSKAKEILNSLVKDYGDTAAGKNAKSYLRLIELNSSKES